MKNKIFLTSIVALAITMPAMAATVEGAPTDLDGTGYSGYYKEDTTYRGAAKYENIGVYEDEVTAEAEYETKKYSAEPGTYIPANLEYGAEDTTAECTAGNYCPGVEDAEYSEEAQGINACPDGFALSAAGASSNTECYRTCDINNMGDTFTNIAHATAVSGNDYYGNGADTCEPTECAKGWHIKPGQSVDLATEFGEKGGVNSAYIDNTGYHTSGTDFGEDKLQSYYGITSAGEWGMAWDNGYVKGTSLCSTQGGTDTWDATDPSQITKYDTLEDETGKKGASYCYCNITGYGDGNGNNIGLSSAWVLSIDYFGAADYCANNCAHGCATAVRGGFESHLRVRAALFGAVAPVPALSTCAANTINIQWDGIDEPTTVTYGGDITTPVSAEKRPGQRFKGWKFTTPTTTGD